MHYVHINVDLINVIRHTITIPTELATVSHWIVNTFYVWYVFTFCFPTLCCLCLKNHTTDCIRESFISHPIESDSCNRQPTSGSLTSRFVINVFCETPRFLYIKHYFGFDITFQLFFNWFWWNVFIGVGFGCNCTERCNSQY